MPRPPKAREPIKLAALTLFVEQGMHATGIREIAKAAGCSEAALYRHWDNKDTLVAQLFQEHLEHVTRLMSAALGGNGSIEDRMRRACRAMYALYDEQPLVFRYVLLVQHELAAVLPPDLRMPQDVLTDFFTAARRDGHTKGDPVLLSAASIGMFLQVATYVIYGRLNGPLARYADEVADYALHLVRG